MMRSRIEQVYGYTVCLLSFVFVLAVLTLFGLRIRAWESSGAVPISTAPTDTTDYTTMGTAVDTQALLVQSRLVELQDSIGQYNTARTAMLRQTHVAEVATTGVILLVCIGMFGLHWRWLNRRSN